MSMLFVTHGASHFRVNLSEIILISQADSVWSLFHVTRVKIKHLLCASHNASPKSFRFLQLSLCLLSSILSELALHSGLECNIDKLSLIVIFAILSVVLYLDKLGIRIILHDDWL